MITYTRPNKEQEDIICKRLATQMAYNDLVECTENEIDSIRIAPSLLYKYLTKDDKSAIKDFDKRIKVAENKLLLWHISKKLTQYHFTIQKAAATNESQIVRKTTGATIICHKWINGRYLVYIKLNSTENIPKRLIAYLNDKNIETYPINFQGNKSVEFAIDGTSLILKTGATIDLL